MLNNKTLYIIILLFVKCLTADNEGCSVPFSSKKDWDIFWPLVFRENGILYETKALDNGESIVSVPVGNEVFISCGPNYIKERPPTEYLRAVCQSDGRFKVKGDASGSKPIRELRCDLRAIEEVLETVSECSTPSTSVHFGYVNPTDKLAYIIGEACYNTRKGKTIFAHVRLTNNSNSSILRTETKSFLKKAHPLPGYKVEFMKAFRLDEFNDRLKNILSVDDIPWFAMENYIDENLLGNQQFYATKKLSWNYLVLHENLLNLKLLKKDISDLNDVDVYIGSHGVTTLKDVNGNDVPIYLNDEKFPIPKIVWFVVKKEEKATAFAVFNNPSLTADDIINNSFCSSKCDEITWLKLSGNKNVYLNGKQGGIVCCNYDEFKKHVEEVPNLKDVKELL